MRVPILTTACLAAAFCLLSACTWNTAGGERILLHQATLTVHPDGTLTVREVVRARSTGDVIQHGLVKQLPGRVQDSAGQWHPVDYEVLEVRRDGSDTPYRLETRGGDTILYLGTRRVDLPPGVHTYELAYRTSRHVFRVGTRRELAWTASAPGSALPRDEVGVTVELPESTERDELVLRGYSGPAASMRQDLRSRIDEQGRAVFRTSGTLGTHEGAVVYVSWLVE